MHNSLTRGQTENRSPKRLRSAITRGLSRETFAALTFVSALIIFEGLILTVPFQTYFIKIEEHEYVLGLGGLLIMLGSWLWMVLFIRASLSSNYIVRIFCLLLFVVATLIEYGYQHAFARFSTVEDLRVAIFDATGEQRITGILTFSDWRAVVPCAAYGVLLFVFRAKRRPTWKILSLNLVALAVFYSALAPYTSGQAPTTSLNAFLRTAILSPWTCASGYHGPRESISFHAVRRPENNIIFVVDES